MFQVQIHWNVIHGGNQRLKCSSRHNTKARQLSGVTASGRINAQCHMQLTQPQADLLLSHTQFVMRQGLAHLMQFFHNQTPILKARQVPRGYRLGKNSFPRGRNVWDSPTASWSKKGKKITLHLLCPYSKATDLGLICLLSFYGTEISGSQEVIEIGEVTKVVVGESPEELLQYSGLPSSKRAAGFLSASCAFSTKGQCSWMKMVQSLAMAAASWGKELVVYPNQSRKPGTPN